MPNSQFDTGALFGPEKANEIYAELKKNAFPPRALQHYEFSRLLETGIWPNYSPASSSPSTVMLVALMINEKVKERLPAWGAFITTPEQFPHFFNELLHLVAPKADGTSSAISYLEKSILMTFLDNCFNSLEVDVVRKEVAKLTAIPIWVSLTTSQLSAIFEQNSKLKRYWSKVEHYYKALSTDPAKAEALALEDLKRRFLWRLMQDFKRTVDALDDESRELDLDAVRYCERFLLLLIDLEGQLTTRRFVNSLVHASHLVTHCQLSQLIRSEVGSLFCDLVQQLHFYARFEIDDIGGGDGSLSLTPTQMTQRHYELMTNLQKACFQQMPERMADFCLLNVGRVDTRKFLSEQLGALTAEELHPIAEYLKLVPARDDARALEENYGRYNDANYMAEIIITHCERRTSQLQRINAQPLYPEERVIWDEKRVPYEHYDGQQVLPLNKLNLQFLTLHDYLLRNFNLFQLESTYEIREDLEDILFRMKPWKHESREGEVVWGGWSRMALSIAGCRVVEVRRPRVGENCPAEVRADVTLVLPKRRDIRREWEALRRNDVLFLIKVEPTAEVGTRFDVRRPFKEQFTVKAVRGGEVDGFIGPDGKVLEEMDSREVLSKMLGDNRTIRLRLDPNQYQLDCDAHVETEVYFSFNLLVRRDPKTNNFKAVLATIRQLLNSECVVPEWLQDLILGYGEPDSAHYSKMSNTVAEVDFNDTFLDYQHLVDSFPGKAITCTEMAGGAKCQPPFKLTFNELHPQHDIAEDAGKDRSIRVEPYTPILPYFPPSVPTGEARHRQNAIRFTPAQVEAIKAGVQPGLTMVVGPPGTGKTDVAVQIIANIYHNWPQQRTLVVTHSNQALNQLFEKIIELDVDERHLLRMGHGEEALETSKDFSRYGRVNYVLKERQRCLAEVERIRDSLGEVGDVAYSCETAGYFYRYTLVRSWDHFVERYEAEKERAAGAGEAAVASTFIAENFPFTRYFGVQFSGQPSDDWLLAQRCWKYVQQLFQKLDEFMAFEMLRNGKDRADYLLVKEAKIIAMTCTHAALRRRDLVEMGFRYDNILMEEAAQILEVETFIPLLLQEPHDGRYRLKRWIMIGDHHQLPPVVQNPAYAKYANMEQSLFARFIRLGVPYVELDAQGRARAELAQLYSWRYAQLGDLSHVLSLSQFQHSNPGFLHTFQFVDVPDFNGVGESTPSAYFYQNLGEAEFAVALFTYMRVLGYPAERISFLTTYNGQASLLRDIVQQRCTANPLIGTPGRISTVDKYQGQQNDYIILSLVRTKHVGHLRDIRRLVVALSRARLGLYILGRLPLFRPCYELQPAFNRLLQHPPCIQLLPNESFEEGGRQSGCAPSMQPIEVTTTEHMAHLVHQLYTANVGLMQQRYAREHPRLIQATGGTEAVANSKGAGSAEPSTASTKGPQAGEVVPMEVTQENEPQAEATTANTQQASVGKERSEGAIQFEQVDFERLQEAPKYG